MFDKGKEMNNETNNQGLLRTTCPRPCLCRQATIMTPGPAKAGLLFAPTGPAGSSPAGRVSVAQALRTLRTPSWRGDVTTTLALGSHAGDRATGTWAVTRTVAPPIARHTYTVGSVRAELHPQDKDSGFRSRKGTDSGSRPGWAEGSTGRDEQHRVD
jgi:hypothetical protein